MSDEGTSTRMSIQSPLQADIMERGVAIRADFDKAYEAELGEVSRSLNQPLFTLMMAGFEGDVGEDSARFHALALLNTAVETVVSGLELIRQAATANGLALLRIAIESAAVAMWIAADSKAFSEYSRSGRKFASTRAIPFVRENLPELPEFWGELSKTTVHPNVIVFGPRRDSAADGQTITFLRRELDLTRDRRALRASSVAAAMLLRVAELTFLVDDPERPGWLRLPDSRFTVTATAARLLDRRYCEFKAGT